MLLGLRFRLRHPFYPDLIPTPAAAAKSDCLAVAGSFDELKRAAARGVRARRAVFTVLDAGSRLLRESERDVLWEAFEVPVFMLLLDRSGRVVAFECEAQNGLHMKRTGVGRAFDQSPCACGRPGPRLLVP